MHALSIILLAALAAPFGAGQAAPPGPDGKAVFGPGSSLRRDLALPVLDGGPEAVPIYGPPGPFDETLPVVVLAFWSLRDPLARVAEKKLERIAEDYADRGVKVFLIESNHDELVAGIGDPLAKIRALRAEEKLTLPLLLDRGNAFADEVGALCSNQVLVADARRIVRYVGGIDNDPREDLRGMDHEPWLREAIDHALEGRSPERSLRRAQGRALKRAPVDPPPKAPPAGKGARNR